MDKLWRLQRDMEDKLRGVLRVSAEGGPHHTVSHADLRPDNILIREVRELLSLYS